MPTMVIDAYWPRASVWSGIILTLGLLLFLYIRENDRKLAKLPREALQASPVRWTEDAIHEAAVRVDHLGPNHPILNHLPDSTHRRYVIVGGVRSFVLLYDAYPLNSYCRLVWWAGG
jgi:hypothetical protein